MDVCGNKSGTRMWTADCGGNVKEILLEKDEVLRDFGKIKALNGLSTMTGSQDGVWLFFGVGNKIIQMNIETLKIVRSFTAAPGDANITSMQMTGVLLSEDEKKAMKDKKLRNILFQVMDDCDDAENCQPQKKSAGFLAMVLTGVSKGVEAMTPTDPHSPRTPAGSFGSFGSPMNQSYALN